MQLSLRRLAEALDGWSEGGRVALTETEHVLVANNLNAADAVELVGMFSDLLWRIEMEDGAGGRTTSDRLTPDFQPFRFVMDKPDDVAGADRLVTNTAFAELLRTGVGVTALRLARCVVPFETMTLRVAPFDDTVGFEPRPVMAKPRKVVRESGARRIVTEDIGHWLLRDTVRMPWTDHAFRTWSKLAVPTVMRALSNEVEQDYLVFRGPPLLRLPLANVAPVDLDEKAFHALQAAAAWVYDNERELEMRHGLYAIEMARTALFGSSAATVFGQAASAALESARIAYGLNLSQVSRDSLKALADLRKAVSDETGKLADGTRTIAGSVATAVFAGVGLLLARMTASAPAFPVVGLAFILVLYVGAVVWSGRRFIQVQAEIRNQWRKRLYVFLPKAEYDEMVETPASLAESAFNLAARLGMLIAVLMFVGVSAFVAFEGPRPQATKVSSAAPSASVMPATPPADAGVPALVSPPPPVGASN